MRKFLSVLLLCTLLLALTTSLTGCKGIVTEGKMKSMVEKALEEKYKEEFKCTAVLSRNINESYNCVCYPVNNEKLKFEARIYTDGVLGGDYYPKSIASAELSEAFDNALGDALGRHLTYAYTAGSIDDDETARIIRNGDFSLEYFLKHWREVFSDQGNLYRVHYTVCVDTSDLSGSFEGEWEAISNALNEVHELGLKYGSDLSFWISLYFTPPKIYKECENYLSRNAEIRSSFEDKILGRYHTEYNRLIEFFVVYPENSFSPNKEEYIKLRKDIE